MAIKVVIQGGAFQKPDGTVLSGGLLILRLSQDAVVTSTAQVVSKRPITITLDVNGNAPNTSVWGNDNLTPSGTVYYVDVLEAAGKPIASTQSWQINGVGPVDLSTMLSTSSSSGVSYPAPELLANKDVANGYAGLDASALLKIAEIPSLDASKITTGALALARGGTNADLSATGGASQVLKQTAGGAAVTVGQLAFTDISGTASAAQVPSLDASKITTGLLPLARGGTNADLSATGGTSRVLKQTTVGGAIAVAQLAAADLSDGLTGTGNVVLANSPTLVTPNIGAASGSALTDTNAGVFTNTQMNETIVGQVGGLTPAEYGAVQGGNFSSDAVTGCIDMPVSATVHQVNGVMGLATNHVNIAQSGGAVGGYFQGRQLASNGAAWGTNSLVQDAVSPTAHQLIGNEVDINVLGAPARAWGILVSGASSGTIPALGSAAGIEIRAPGYALANALRWPAALNIPDATATAAINIGATGSGNSVGSQPINFKSRDAGGVVRTAAISTNLNGALNVAQVVAVVDLANQTAAIGSPVTIYSIPANGAGMYAIDYILVLTQAATTSSTLGNISLFWTDQETSVANGTASATYTGNALGQFVSNRLNLSAKASTNLTYTTGYVSSGATVMKYSIHLRVTYLG